MYSGPSPLPAYIGLLTLATRPRGMMQAKQPLGRTGLVGGEGFAADLVGGGVVAVLEVALGWPPISLRMLTSTLVP